MAEYKIPKKTVDLLYETVHTDIMDNALLKELVHCANNLRAEMIYLKCIRAGKLKWAQEIRKEYDLKSRQYDSTLALGYAMMYLQNKEENEHT